MSEMDKRDSVERFNESLKKASSRARELGVSQKDQNWFNISKQLDEMRKMGMKIFESKSMSRQDVLGFLDNHTKELTGKETIQ